MPQNKIPPTYNTVQMVEIDDEYSSQRIDNFLVTYLKGVPKSLVYRILRKGEVRVNKGRIKPQYRLQTGDIVRIPPIRYDDAKNSPEIGEGLAKSLKSRILFEDDYLIVLNKPAGLAVHGGSGVSYGVIEALRSLYPEVKRLELVHRLDRATSGCLILTKKAAALKVLHEHIRQDRIEKYFLALLKGQVSNSEGQIDLALRKFITKSGERMVVVDAEGKRSVSQYKVQQVFKDTTLVEYKLLTGRTHQLRVHSTAIGHPICGDEKYGDVTFNNLIKRRGLKRMFLHARRLKFMHPVTNMVVDCNAPLDPDLSSLLKSLGEQ